MVFVPISRGICAVHWVVPEATPEAPNAVDHLTDATPTLSVAVPPIASVARVVEKLVLDGDAIARVGGVVSPVGEAGAEGVVGVPGVEGAAGAGGWNVTMTEREICAAPDMAVTVIVFEPAVKGTLEMVQADAGPCA